MGQASPNKVIHQKTMLLYSWIHKKHFNTGDSPTNLSVTYAKYFYSNFCCGCTAASATGSTGEDKGYSVSDGTMFGSVRAGAMFVSDQGSMPSTGWMMSSWPAPSAAFAQ